MQNKKFVFQNVLMIILWSLLLNTNIGAKGLPEHTTKVADGVYTFGDPAGGYISMFVVTKKGVIVVEPNNTAHSTAMLKAIKKVTKKPIKYLLHSHNHWDHSGGGQVFRDVGATIIAHAEAYEWMKANPHDDMVLPDESWAGNRKNIELDKRTIELYYFGMNHGLGMTVFRLPKDKIIFIADIVTPNRLLFTIVPDFNVKEWIRTLKEIEEMDFEKVIFTHGSPTVGTKKDIAGNREFIEDLQNAIYAEFQKGTNPFMIPNVVKVPKYEKWAMYDEWLTMNAWRLLLDGHMGPFPWRPDHPYEMNK